MASARGLFIVGFTRDEILNIQARAKEQLLDGKTLMEWQAGDTRGRKEQAMSVADVISECAYALQTLFPEDYGGVPISRTTVRYVG